VGRVLRFSQVDVFSAEPFLGNPVAVVHDADGVTDEEMRAFASWTNLSETTFLLTPTDPGADYRLRIFTPSVELPFAGHPTIGSAHAWLEAGGAPHTAGEVVQECGVGLVRLRLGGRLAFAAPPLVRSGPVADADRAAVVRALRVPDGLVEDMAWIDNGPGWVGVLLPDARSVLGLQPDWNLMDGLDIGVVGPYPEGGEVAVEVRAFCRGAGINEDPVTGSLNAGIAQWLAGDRLPASYVASQGTVLGRRGRVFVERDPHDPHTVWVGGDARTRIAGEVGIGR
jgi:PhzF family phenazine biosynthesis protein